MTNRRVPFFGPAVGRSAAIRSHASSGTARRASTTAPSDGRATAPSVARPSSRRCTPGRSHITGRPTHSVSLCVLSLEPSFDQVIDLVSNRTPRRAVRVGTIGNRASSGLWTTTSPAARFSGRPTRHRPWPAWPDRSGDVGLSAGTGESRGPRRTAGRHSGRRE